VEATLSFARLPCTAVPLLEFSARTAQVGPETFVVSVTGEADVYSAPSVEREFQSALDLGGRFVAVDLADVGFVDSTVLALLVRFDRRFRTRGGEMVVISDDRRVLRTFEITGLDRVLRMERRLADAVGRLLAAAPAGNGTAADAP
jgi:anti-sigma B factor antagonist